MLQVDENIGGRQDQKNNRLRTKTLIVGLLMVVGCFAVGYFSAGTSMYGVGCEDPSTYNPTPTPRSVLTSERVGIPVKIRDWVVQRRTSNASPLVCRNK